MKFSLTTLSIASATTIALAGSLMGQTVPRQQMVDEVFKNIQVLKGITVDDFMGTMGVMSAAIGFCCSECHNNAGTEKVDWAADDNPRKIRARQMTLMVKKINDDNFRGRSVVTCYTCHKGRDIPIQTPNMETVYGPGPTDPGDVILPADGQPKAETIIDRYLTAIGGAAKADAIKSYIATGKSIGFGGFGNEADATIYAKAPMSRTTWIKFKAETERPAAIRVTNGVTGWFKTPLAVISEYQLTGNELNGAKVDAMLGFPSQLKAFTNLHTGLPQAISDMESLSSQNDQVKQAPGIGRDRPVNVVQGSGPGGELTTLYFDQQTNLLLRMVRYSATPIGRVPTQVDFSDYKEVNGVKLPHKLAYTWLDGRDYIQIEKFQINVDIPEAKFSTPANVMRP